MRLKIARGNGLAKGKSFLRLGALLVASICAPGSLFAAPWPVSTSFEAAEGYTVGDLNGQKGWVTSNTATVQTAEVHAGAQAVALTSRSQTLYEVQGNDQNVVWVDAFCKTTPDEVYPELPQPPGVSCFLFFHVIDGITCLDGDGVGSGAWRNTGIPVAEWTRIAIRQDYAAHTWDLYANGAPVLTGLGNAYNTTSFQKFECQAGSGGSMYLDDFYSAADAATPTPTPTVQPSPTPSPSPSPVHSPIPTPTQTPAAGVTPTPTVEPIRALIDSFYQMVLGRAPEPGAVDAWHHGYFDHAVSFNIDVRFIPREMARLFFLSEEYAARNRTDQEFITDCYRVFLERDPNPQELADWLAGVWNRSQVMTIFSESEEFAARIAAMYPGLGGDPTRNFVTFMYIGLLDRLVDKDGLEYASGLFDVARIQGGTEAVRAQAKQMAREVIVSEEFLAKQPQTADYVVRFYRAFLGRFPNDTETTYWSGEIDSGRRTTDDAIELFADS
ncbi:MAG TPA: DUF4214 domain-containing protein, partial [Sumerlaeia bacterium]|nr:DUF4214 domain-containing protein [Sumerlaeia bacterium]